MSVFMGGLVCKVSCFMRYRVAHPLTPEYLTPYGVDATPKDFSLTLSPCHRANQYQLPHRLFPGNQPQRSWNPCSVGQVLS